jgi:hypothetical protein
MKHARVPRNRWVLTIAALSGVLALGTAAQAQPDESQPAEPTPPAARSAEVESPPAPPAPLPTAVASQPAGTTPFIEEMGPETFPGQHRGIEGGSLWLEPTFHGLQWPLNTRTGIGISGYVWADLGNEKIQRNQAQIPDTTLYVAQDRGVLRLTPGYVSDDFFIQGQIELVGSGCQAANDVCKNNGTFTTDDLWIRFGHRNSWDLKVGRFEGWEIYHVGMGMDRYTPERFGAGMLGVDSNVQPKLEAPTLYGVDYLRDRPGQGIAVGSAAVHWYPADLLRFELLGRVGTDNYRADNSTGDTPANYWGVRPVGIIDAGFLKLKFGGEYTKKTTTTQTIAPGNPGQKKDGAAERKNYGFGATALFVFDPSVEFGVNAAYGHQADTDGFGKDVGDNSYTTKSFGGFGNLKLADRFLLGVGVHYTEQLDEYLAEQSTVNNYTSQLQTFLALQYALAGRLYIKGVFSYAKANFQPSLASAPTWDNTMLGARVRLMYLF